MVVRRGEGALPSCPCSLPASQLGLGMPAPLSPWLHRSWDREGLERDFQAPGIPELAFVPRQHFSGFGLCPGEGPRISDFDGEIEGPFPRCPSLLSAGHCMQGRLGLPGDQISPHAPAS